MENLLDNNLTTNSSFFVLLDALEEKLLSPFYQHTLPAAVLLILVYLFILLLCLLGNGLVCVIVLRNRHMRTVTNIFILNLAVSDLLVGLFCIPTTLVDNLITGWPFDDVVCKLSGFIQGTSVCASVFTLVLIAVDRFRLVVHPLRPRLSLRVVNLSVGSVWLLALVVMLPAVLMLRAEEEAGHFTVHAEDANSTYPLLSCFEAWPEVGMRRLYTLLLFLLVYVLPLALILLLYGGIALRLSSGPRRPLRRNLRALKMLALVALLFMLSWLPLWTLMLLMDYGQPDPDTLEVLTRYVFPLSHWLAFANSSVNPVIYGYFNRRFRRAFQDACRCVRHAGVQANHNRIFTEMVVKRRGGGGGGEEEAARRTTTRRKETEPQAKKQAWESSK